MERYYIQPLAKELPQQNKITLKSFTEAPGDCRFSRPESPLLASPPSPTTEKKAEEEAQGRHPTDDATSSLKIAKSSTTTNELYHTTMNALTTLSRRLGLDANRLHDRSQSTEDEEPNTGTGNSNPKLAGRRSTYLTRIALGPLEDCWRGKILAPSIKSIAQKEIFTFTPKSPPTKKSKNQTPLIGSDADEETNQTLQFY